MIGDPPTLGAPGSAIGANPGEPTTMVGPREEAATDGAGRRLDHARSNSITRALVGPWGRRCQ